MSYIDNDPPKQLDIGSLTKGKNFNIYTSEGKSKYKYNLYFTLEEKLALIKHEGAKLFDVHTNSKSVYKEALQTLARIRKYIENDNNEKEMG